jgi:hypothetical protein
MSKRNPFLEWKNLGLIALTALVVGGGAYYFLSDKTPPQLLEIGIPMYPGADVSDGAEVRKRLTQAGKPSSLQAVVLLTEDHPVRVAAYYQETIKEDVKVLEMSKLGNPSAILAVGTGDDQRWITISIDPDSGKTLILITRLYSK